MKNKKDRKSLHWTQRPDAKAKLKEAHRKANQTRINQRIAASDEEFESDENRLREQNECRYCGKKYTSAYLREHEEKRCKANPKIRRPNVDEKKPSREAAVRVFEKLTQGFTEWAISEGHFKVLATDHSKDIMIIQIPLLVESEV